MKLEANDSFFSSSKHIALLSLAIACLVSSFLPVFIKWSEQEVHVVPTVFYRFFFGALIFGLGNVIDSGRGAVMTEKDEVDAIDRASPKIVLLLACTGLFAAFTQFSWVLSFTQTSVGSSELLHSLSPLCIAIYAWLFLKRDIEPQLLGGMVIAIVGSALLVAGDFQVSQTQLQGDGFALLSAVFFAAYLVTIESLRTYLSSSLILFWRCFVGAILVLPWLLSSSDRIIPDSTSGWLVIIGLTLTTVVAQWLITYSLAVLSSTLVSIILLIMPLLCSIQAWFFFSEELHILGGVSFGIVTLGVYLAITADSKEAEVSQTPPAKP